MTIETGRLAKQAAGAALVTYGETVVLVTATPPSRARDRLLPADRRLRREDLGGGQDPGRLLQARRAPRRIARCSSRASSTARSARCSRTATATRRRSSRPCSRRTREHAGHPGLHRRLGGAHDLGDPVPGADRGRAHGPHRRASLDRQPDSARRPPTSDLDLVVAGSRGALVMVEGGAKQCPRRELLAGAPRAHREIAAARSMPQEELRRRAGKPKLARGRRRRTAAALAAQGARARPRRSSRRRSQIRASTSATRRSRRSRRRWSTSFVERVPRRERVRSTRSRRSRAPARGLRELSAT